VILAALADVARYVGLHPLFPDAFAWLAAHRDATAGRHAIHDDRLFALLDVGTTHDRATRRFESHRRYIDIQINLAGGEAMEWTPVAGLTVADDFTPDGDIAFYVEPTRPVTRLAVPVDHVAMFWPADAHKPVLHVGSAPTPYRKVVFKVDLAG